MKILLHPARVAGKAGMNRAGLKQQGRHAIALRHHLVCGLDDLFMA